MIVRLVVKPAKARWAGRVLMSVGILAIPGSAYLVTSSPGVNPGWNPIVAILVGILATGIYGVWLLGFVLNRAAFAQDSRETEK